jgi:hypothetical protein
MYNYPSFDIINDHVKSEITNSTNYQLGRKRAKTSTREVEDRVVTRKMLTVTQIPRRY